MKKAETEMMLPAVLDPWVNNVARNEASHLKIPTGFHHSAQGCEGRATLGCHPNKSSTATRLHHPSAKQMQPVPGCIPFDSSTQRRPTPSSNAGLNDEIPLGFWGTSFSASLKIYEHEQIVVCGSIVPDPLQTLEPAR
ncbi:MAG: hypothetical protein ABSE90_04335 [Verrucomicrobiota bacterium]